MSDMSDPRAHGQSDTEHQDGKAPAASPSALDTVDIELEEPPADAKEATTFVPGETPVVETGSSIPAFLAHAATGDEAPDPEPLDRSFRVVNGGGASFPKQDYVVSSGATGVMPALAPRDPEPEEELEEVDQPRDITQVAADAARSIGSFVAQGAGAVREMQAARSALADARADLRTLNTRIESAEKELAWRQDIDARFDEIIAEKTAAKKHALEEAANAEVRRDGIKQKIDTLKEQLKQMRDEDTQTEKRLKANVDALEAEEKTSLESSTRLTRRLDDAKRALQKSEEERASGVAAAQLSAQRAQERLQTLRAEYTDLQQNPSLNSANYSVRMNQLSAEISDAADAVREAQEALPQVKDELELAVATARKAVATAQEPIDEARRAHAAVTAKADTARDELQNAKNEAAERQRELRDQISQQETARREQETRMQEAAAEAEAAQAAMDEATDVHNHPDITEAIAGMLAADRREADEAEREVAELEVVERTVRERTRGSRLRFVAAIVAGAIFVLIVVIACLVLAN